MKTNNIIQGTPEWHAYRAKHFNASDAPAMMGCSPYKTRTQLLNELHTGIAPEVDIATQRRFDEGHRFEALTRPLAEKIIGMSLYPVTGSEGKLSASFDGLTMCETVAFEHKTLNDELRSALQTDDNSNLLPLQYRVQMEQQLMVSGAEKVLFMASKWQGEELIEERHCWYESDYELRQNIIQCWAQFAVDLASYVPIEVLQPAVAAPVMALPAVFVNVTGELAVKDNLELFGIAVKKYISELPEKPSTDQEFADADAGCKAMERAEEALKTAKAQTLGQVASIDSVVRTVDVLTELCRTTRLSLEKLVKARKEAIRTEIVQGAVKALSQHIDALNTKLGKVYMPISAMGADFAGVIKGKKTVESLQNAVDTELACAKIEANAVADKIQTNLNTVAELASNHQHLFVDINQIALKATDDFTALVKTRIADFNTAEEARLTAERDRIRAEEVARLEKEAKAAQDAKAATEKAEQKAPPAVGVKPVEDTPTAPACKQVGASIAADEADAPITVDMFKTEQPETQTRAKIDKILDGLSEANLSRVLLFVQTKFTQVTA